MGFELSPEKLVYGGDALGHAQGRAVLVPYALPGERLEVETVRTAKGVVHARPLRLLAAAPERIEPPCPYFGRCGGCQYQHFPADRQAEAKQEIMLETLRRIGKIVWEGDVRLHAARPWNYRNQAQFKVSCAPDGKAEIGFYEAESHRLVPVDACLVLSPRLNAILAELRTSPWINRLRVCREIELLADDRDERVMATLRGCQNKADSTALARDLLAHLPGAVTVATEHQEDLTATGQPGLDYTVGGFRYRVSPGSFFQASRFLLSGLVTEVTEGYSGDLALDLFAGVGLFTLPLGRQFKQVIAVEVSPSSVRDLRTNLATYETTNVRVARQSVFDFLRRFAQAEPDLVVLDPPRAGVGLGTLKRLLAASPRRIYYVSCSPPTLARDLAYLVARGYRIETVELFDFFPQTYHIECLARLIRSFHATG